jgi:dipeptidyl aminopeptidase/acylaminoacyl peptidase
LLGNARAVLLLAGTLLAGIPAVAQETKSVITLDEFMNATEIKEAKLSPDGSAAVMTTVDSDWQHNRYRSDLWIWKAKTGETLPLTRSGHAHSPQWSPDGRWVALHD